MGNGVKPQSMGHTINSQRPLIGNNTAMPATAKRVGGTLPVQTISQRANDNEYDESENNLNQEDFSDNNIKSDEQSKREIQQQQKSQKLSSNNPQLQIQLEDEELKKKIALYYHTLFQGCLGQWFILLQQNNYSKLTKQQYMELNMRIQKSLILDFDFESAQESALEDWKIDIERETFDKRNTSNPDNKQLQQINEEDNQPNEDDQLDDKKHQEEPFLIDFERLSEFFFDLCLSWCQYLDIETFLFFLNGIFLNITKGSHVNISTFKQMDEIEVLSIEFFNSLLAYRAKCEQIQEQAVAINGTGESYKDWYSRNFVRQGEIVRSVEKQLHESFKEKQENRILDLWIDMPTQTQNQYINQHFDKLDKDFKQMQKATKATELLTNSMNMMEQIKKINLNDKTKRTGASGQDQSFKLGLSNLNTTNALNQDGNYKSNSNETSQNNNKIMLGNTDITRRGPLKISNTKELRQSEIERHLVGQLGERYKHAKLIEISENSYLIQADVRLPIFGRPFQLIERTKTSISKRGYLLKLHPEYTSQNRRNIIEQRQERQNHHLIVNNKDLNNASQAIPSGLNHQSGTSQANGVAMKNVVYEKIKMKPLPNHNGMSDHTNSVTPHVPGQPLNLQNRRDSLGKDTLDSESDAQLAIQQQISSYDNTNPSHLQHKLLINQYSEEQKSGINVKMPDLIPQTQMSSLVINNEGNVVGGGINGALGTSYISGGGLQNQTLNQINGEDSNSMIMMRGQQYFNQNSSAFNNTTSQGVGQNQQNFYMSNMSGSNQQQYTQSYTYPSKSPTNIEERAINQVYDRYLQLLQEDKQAAPSLINDILREETFTREFSGINLNEGQIEQAVLERLQAEEESAEIQEMIAKFYNKFDELHEQSVSMALAKSPNKQQVKNEIKYKIPERWTKRFHKHDIIPLSLYSQSAVNQERGRVNKPAIISHRQKLNDQLQQSQQQHQSNQEKQIKGQNNHTINSINYNTKNFNFGLQQQQLQQRLQSQQQQQILNQQQQQFLQMQQAQQIPLNNSMLKESLSSRATPKSEYKRKQRSSLPGDLQPMYNQQSNNGMTMQQPQPPIIFKNTHVNELHNQSQDVTREMLKGGDINQSDNNLPRDDMADSTDVSKAGDFSRRGSEYKSSGNCKPQFYDWSEVAHLFEEGVVPEELLSISDPIEYNYILVRLKKDFNEKNKSEYIKYMNLQLPYHSRRDEIGGVITLEEWGNFVNRLEGIIDKVKKRRRRMIKRRKKKGNKKLPRKTLFKPIPRPNLAQDPLWREVFLESSSDEGDESGEDMPGSGKKEDDFMDIYQLGLKSVASQKSTMSMFQKNAAQILGLNGVEDKNKKSRVGTGTNKNKGGHKTMQNIELTAQELSLPPIMRPLLHEDLKNSGRQKSSTGKLRTAQMNLKETLERFPENKNMLNMRFKDYYYDPFDKEPHKASRMIGADTSIIQKMEHTYGKKIRRSVARQQQTFTASIMNQTNNKVEVGNGNGIAHAKNQSSKKHNAIILQ